MLDDLRFRLGLGGRRTEGVANGEDQPLLTPARTPVSFLPGPMDILALWLGLMAFTTNMLLDGIMYAMAVFTDKLTEVTAITNLKLSSHMATKNMHFCLHCMYKSI